MTIQIENEYPNDLTGFLSEEEYTEIANRVILAALDYEECPYEAEVDLLLTDDEGIREMNAQFRELDRSTDVLSFPLVDYEAPGCFDGFDDLDEYFNPDSGELMLGDIVISVDHCKAQAEEYGHAIRREFAFLIAHSMLHLMGYDHMVPEEAKDMEARQEEILTELGFVR